jgi:hypothetical protein
VLDFRNDAEIIERAFADYYLLWLAADSAIVIFPALPLHRLDRILRVLPPLLTNRRARPSSACGPAANGGDR